MLQPGVVLPQLIAETHVQFQVDWTRLATTLILFGALAGFVYYLEMRGAPKNKKK
jgi:hypothetical protein